jgi:phage terminase large subunit
LRELRVAIPYWPRSQFAAYHDRTERWAAIVAHRRFGKTVGCINDMIPRALVNKLKRPQYGFISPTYGQAKRTAWEYLKEYTAPFPHRVVMESELTVTLPNEARITLYGADNFDRMRGIYLDGAVLDEYGDMDPRVFPEVVRPALSDRQGWATFIGSAKGHNHFYKVMHGDKDRGTLGALKDPAWFGLVLPASQTGVLPQEELDSARTTMTREQYDQEYECSFDSAIVGAYYGRDLRDAETEGRVAAVPYDRAADCFAAWDLGVGDSTAIWVAQSVGREIHLIDYIENSGVALDWYVGELNAKPYRITEHFLPHDAGSRELQTGKSRTEFLEARGYRTRVLPRLPVDDGINAVRMVLNRCWFDAKNCERGIEALKMYRAEWDDKRQTLRATPVHDWASHGADAFRYLVTGLDERSPAKKWEKPRALQGIV